MRIGINRTTEKEALGINGAISIYGADAVLEYKRSIAPKNQYRSENKKRIDIINLQKAFYADRRLYNEIDTALIICGYTKDLISKQISWYNDIYYDIDDIKNFVDFMNSAITHADERTYDRLKTYYHMICEFVFSSDPEALEILNQQNI